uniref:Uncharacterized protein n=1 Tax=Anopheles quadriannulatus TaxID=34691 RepID=A0A182XS68_ANOQN
SRPRSLLFHRALGAVRSGCCFCGVSSRLGALARKTVLAFPLVCVPRATRTERHALRKGKESKHRKGSRNPYAAPVEAQQRSKSEILNNIREKVFVASFLCECVRACVKAPWFRL